MEAGGAGSRVEEEESTIEGTGAMGTDMVVMSEAISSWCSWARWLLFLAGEYAGSLDGIWRQRHDPREGEGANRLKLTSSARNIPGQQMSICAEECGCRRDSSGGVEGSERCKMRLHSLPQRRIPDGQPVCGESQGSQGTTLSLPGKKPPLMVVRLEKADLQEHAD